MPTLQQQRRSIAEAMAAGRGATGQASRQATGKAITEQRTGRAVVDDLNRLTNVQPVRRSLRPVAPVGALPASRGRGEYKPPAQTQGGGIAGPLSEKRSLVNGKYVPDREYWPAGYTSSDGLFILPAIKMLKLTDANGDDVEIMLANPEGTIE